MSVPSRRRMLGLAAAIAVLALVAIVGTRLSDDAKSRVVPARTVDLPAPAGFQAAVIPYASIAYPEGWYLLDTSVTQPSSCPAAGCPLHPSRSERREQQSEPFEAVPGPVLQLANFDPDVSRAPLCVADTDPLQRFTPTEDQGGVPSIPRNGVLLTVGIAAKGDRPPGGPGKWPASLERYPEYVDPVCAQMQEQARWRAPSGVIYWASAGWGRSAAQQDIDALHRAFRTLQFPPRDGHAVENEDPFAFIGSLGGTMGRAERVQDGACDCPTPRLVLDSVTYGQDVLTFVARLEVVFTGHPPQLALGVESNGPWGDAWVPRTGSAKEEPVSGGSVGARWGDAALLDGVISPEVSRVEVLTRSGDAEPRYAEVPVHVIPLPASLRTTDRYVWALVTGNRSTMREEIEGYDGDCSLQIDTPSCELGRGAYIAGYDRNGDLIY